MALSFSVWVIASLLVALLSAPPLLAGLLLVLGPSYRAWQKAKEGQPS
jgi:hypothetical protein